MKHVVSRANSHRLIEQTCFEQKWSNRTQAKLIRIARTISDLEGQEAITDSALQEAIDWKRPPFFVATIVYNYGRSLKCQDENETGIRMLISM